MVYSGGCYNIIYIPYDRFAWRVTWFGCFFCGIYSVHQSLSKTFGYVEYDVDFGGCGAGGSAYVT